MGRTYQEVFGVPIGSEIKETQGINYVPCDAVKALKQVLGAHTFFTASKLGGIGPLYRIDSGTGHYKHEFNRHHAGLAVDIMLNQTSDQEVALGQNLVRLFEQHQAVMKWRSIVYQDYTNNPGGGTDLQAGCWTEGGHYDHIHVDWFNISGVVRRSDITTIPLRKKDGTTVVDMDMPRDGIAESISWPTQADTDFSGDTNLQRDLRVLMDQHGRGELRKIQLGAAVCQTSPLVSFDLAGKWEVIIGDGGWTGLFVFDQMANVYWTELKGGVPHRGRWTATTADVQWSFSDPGDFRVFKVSLPLYLSKTRGIVLPKGQGWFEMKKV